MPDESAGVDSLIDEQVAYYRARAPEYDQRLNDLHQYIAMGGSILNPTEDHDADQGIASALGQLNRHLPADHVLEIACGTGWWTQWLARSAQQVTALDAAPEMLALNRERVGLPNVRYEQADVFSWQPDRQYDLVFFAFWLSHVPEPRFEAFWRVIREALAPGGHFFLIDELRNAAAVASETSLGGEVVARTVKDGRAFRAVKVYHGPVELTQRLRALGFDAEVESCGRTFYFGHGTLASGSASSRHAP